MSNKAFAEVVVSNLYGFQAQCWQWDFFPAFGSLIAIPSTDRTIFGLVHQVQTGSMDGARTPFAYQKTEQELRAEQPQIFEFLQTTFDCLTLGYAEGKSVHYLIAPQPPKIHAFVQPASTAQLKQFFARHQYLHVLFNNAPAIGCVDELLLALLRHLNDANLLGPPAFNEFVDTFCLLTGNDYRRLKLLLQRAQEFVPAAQMSSRSDTLSVY